jgi:hypothetical protein
MWTVTMIFGALGLAITMFASDANAANEPTVTRSNCVNGGGKWVCAPSDNCYCVTPGKPKSKDRPPR